MSSQKTQIDSIVCDPAHSEAAVVTVNAIYNLTSEIRESTDMSIQEYDMHFNTQDVDYDFVDRSTLLLEHNDFGTIELVVNHTSMPSNVGRTVNYTFEVNATVSESEVVEVLNTALQTVYQDL